MQTPNPNRDFELSVMRTIERSLNSGGLGIDPSCGRVYHNKAYHSKERDGNIVVDVALEIFRRGAIGPFLVWVWECKNYSHSVPIDDVEEFHAKLQQIGSDRTKGTIVTTAAFQRASVAYAQSHGIGLVRVLRPNTLSFDLENAVVVSGDDVPVLLNSDRVPPIAADAIAVAVGGHFLLGFDNLLRHEIISES